MANPNSPRYRRIFVAQQTGSYPGNYRVAASAGLQLVRVPESAVAMDPVMPITPVNWLTGTRSDQPGIGGRKQATWELRNIPCIPSGTPGTHPDIDVFLQNIFGQASTGGVSNNVYSFLDSGLLPFTLFDFPHNIPTLTNRLIWGCFVTEFNIVLNGNILTMDLRGGGGYLLDSDNFSSEPTAAKGGLGSYPSEPGSASFNGAIIPGFGATCSIDSQSGLEQKIVSMNIQGTTGFELIGDVLADAYPIYAVGGTRRMSATVGFVDDDSTTLQDIKQKAKQQATVPFTVTVGTVAGSKLKIDGNNLQMIPPRFQDQGNRVITDFGQGLFHGSAVGNTDDITMTFL